MSPELKQDFESEWHHLERRLNRLLERKGVPHSHRDDIVQDTALRLLSMWTTVDRTRSAWPLTVTIAANLLRDRARALARVTLEEVTDGPGVYDIDRDVFARVEFQRVMRALAKLSQTHRDALLSEIGAVGTNGTTPAAAKMMRLRARRKLQAMLEKVSAGLVLRSRRFVEVIQGLLGSGEGLIQGAACLLCIVVGLTPAVLQPTTPETALSGPAVVGEVAVVSAAIDAATSKATLHRPGAAADAQTASSSAATRRARQRAGTGLPSKSTPSKEASRLTVTPPGAETLPLPDPDIGGVDGGGGGGGEAPPLPDPPTQDRLPEQEDQVPVNSLPVPPPDVVGQVEEVLDDPLR